MPGIERLKKRADFLRIAAGQRWTTPRLMLQAAAYGPKVTMPEDRGLVSPAPMLPRLGFTVTKKIGNAVVRNRVRRRLKAALETSTDRLRSEGLIKPGHDYVIVARSGAILAPFDALIEDIATAFASVHRARSSARSRG